MFKVNNKDTRMTRLGNGYYVFSDLERNITPSLAFLSNKNDEMRNQLWFWKLIVRFHYPVIFRSAS